MKEIFNFDNEVDPIDLKFKKGDKNELIKKIQNAINAIAGYRNQKEIISSNNIKFILPLKVTGVFDEETNVASTDFFPSYKNSGLISVRDARKRWVHASGFYGEPYPSPLTSVSNYDELKSDYVNGAVYKAELNKKLLLEKMILVLESLGLKYLKITDLSSHSGKLKINAIGQGNGEANYNAENLVLREKKYGKTIYNPEIAINELDNLKQIPKIISTIKGRIENNLLSEKLVEQFRLNAGITVNIASIAAELEFKLNNSWEIELEFYPKDDFLNL
jgi:hypothetical protein